MCVCVLITNQYLSRVRKPQLELGASALKKSDSISCSSQVNLKSLFKDQQQQPSFCAVMVHDKYMLDY